MQQSRHTSFNYGSEAHCADSRKQFREKRFRGSSVFRWRNLRKTRDVAGGGVRNAAGVVIQQLNPAWTLLGNCKL
jgi:hypothetical protein